MNEELKQQLSAFLSRALDVAEKGIDAAGEQIPMLLQEIVQWQMAKGAGCLVLAILCVVVFAVALSNAIKRFSQANGEDKNFALGMFCVIVCVFTFCSAFPAFSNGFLFVKAIVAPRLVIIDYLKGL